MPTAGRWRLPSLARPILHAVGAVLAFLPTWAADGPLPTPAPPSKTLPAVGLAAPATAPSAVRPRLRAAPAPVVPDAVRIHVTLVYDQAAINAATPAGLAAARVKTSQPLKQFVAARNGVWWSIDINDPVAFPAGSTWPGYVAAQGGAPLVVIQADNVPGAGNAVPAAVAVRVPGDPATAVGAVQAAVAAVRGGR